MKTAGTFEEAWVMEDIAIKVERLMRQQKVTRAMLADRLEATGSATKGVSREWVARLLEGKLDPDKFELKHLVDVFFVLGQEVNFKLEKVA